VGFGSDRTFLGDTTGLAATLTAVPEPASIVMLRRLAKITYPVCAALGYDGLYASSRC
jgi:hypothetical protein